MPSAETSVRRPAATRVVLLLAAILLAACDEAGDMLDQSVLVGEWSGPMDDSTRFTMTLRPEGDGATTVIARSRPDRGAAASDTTRYAGWWYFRDDSDSAADSTERELCLFREDDLGSGPDDPDGCHTVHALRGDTLDMTVHGGQRLHLLRIGAAVDTSASRDERRP